MASSYKVAVSEEGAQALDMVANTLPDCVERIDMACNLLSSVADENAEVLGPHQNRVAEILEEVQRAQADSKASVIRVETKLRKLSSKIREIVDTNF